MSEQNSYFDGWYTNTTHAVITKQEKLDFSNMPPKQRLCMMSLLLQARADHAKKMSEYTRARYQIKMQDPTEREKHRKQTQEANRERMRSGKFSEHRKHYRETNPQFRLADCGRSKIGAIYRGANKYKVLGFLGCTRDEFLAHIESKFQPGMSWGNRGYGAGKWVTDHIKPCACFDLTDPEQYKACFHYTNLRPVWCRDNSLKSSFHDGIHHGRRRPSLAVIPPTLILPKL